MFFLVVYKVFLLIIFGILFKLDYCFVSLFCGCDFVIFEFFFGFFNFVLMIGGFGMFKIDMVRFKSMV